MNWLQKLLAWLTPSQESIEGMIAQSMWTDGYTDFEISEAIKDYRKTIQREKDEDTVA